MCGLLPQSGFFFFAQSSVSDPTMAPPTVPRKVWQVCFPTNPPVRPPPMAPMIPLSPSAGGYTLYCGSLNEVRSFGCSNHAALTLQARRWDHYPGGADDNKSWKNLVDMGCMEWFDWNRPCFRCCTRYDKAKGPFEQSHQYSCCYSGMPC